MRQIVLVSGRICTGKSGLGRRLHDEYGYHPVRTSDLVKEEAKKRKLPCDRLSLQALGDKLDGETDHRWVLDAALKATKGLNPTTPLVVDNIRTFKQLEHFRMARVGEIVHAHLYAPEEELERRYKKKNADRPGEVAANYSEADLLKNEEDIQKFMVDADVRINTARTDGRDTLVRVAARLGLYSPPDVRWVDVLIGGQYGSEGKGHIAAYLSKDYDVLIRVGGPNAGHTVSSASGVYTYHQLPSGAKDTDFRTAFTLPAFPSRNRPVPFSSTANVTASTTTPFSSFAAFTDTYPRRRAAPNSR